MAMNVKETLDALLYFPVEESILLSANHGVGKSAVVKMAARKLDIPCIDFRLSQNDVGDLKGMPFRVEGRTIFAPPEFMPLASGEEDKLQALLGKTAQISSGKYGEYGILFLDEINRANREVQQAAFELVLDRRLNLRSLPPGWRVVAAINGDDSIYTVGQMEPAFLSRFFLIDFNPSKQEWFDYAEGRFEQYAEEKLDPKKFFKTMPYRTIHQAVLQFLKRYEELLDPTVEQLKEAVAKGVSKVQDRRAWEKLSRTIHRLEDLHKEGLYHKEVLKDLNFVHRVANGYVGQLAGTKFRSFVESDYKTLTAEAIVNDFNKKTRDHILASIEAGRYPELSVYTEMVVDYLSKNVKKLSDKQKKNLTEYFKLLPKEPAGDLWVKLLNGAKELAMDWYEEKGVQEEVLRVMVNPNAQKKATA